MPVRPMLLHHMGLVSFLLFCKNLGNLQEVFGQMVYRPPGRKLPVRLCMITLLVESLRSFLDKSGKRKQRFLPLPDLSRKIEGDSLCRVMLYPS